MAGRIRIHLRRNVYGLIAIFIALGGSAYAAVELEKNEVKSKHIKNSGVKTKDLANNAVTSPKVANASLLGEDFAPGQLPAGPQGPQGERGIQGERGPSGATSLVRRAGTAVTVLPDNLMQPTVSCNAGERAVSGGWGFGGGDGMDVIVRTNQPQVDGSGIPTSWYFEFLNQDSNGDNLGNIVITPYVLCASP